MVSDEIARNMDAVQHDRRRGAGRVRGGGASRASSCTSWRSSSRSRSAASTSTARQVVAVGARAARHRRPRLRGAERARTAGGMPGPRAERHAGPREAAAISAPTARRDCAVIRCALRARHRGRRSRAGSPSTPGSSCRRGCSRRGAAARIEALGARRAMRYARRCSSRARGAAELDELVEAVRVGETRFFRHRAQVAALVTDVVVPALRARAAPARVAGVERGLRQRRGAVHAGRSCSRAAACPTSSVSVLATDVSADALEIARGGDLPGARRSPSAPELAATRSSSTAMRRVAGPARARARW